jgi:hypothetical protein
LPDPELPPVCLLESVVRRASPGSPSTDDAGGAAEPPPLSLPPEGRSAREGIRRAVERPHAAPSEEVGHPPRRGPLSADEHQHELFDARRRRRLVVVVVVVVVVGRRRARTTDEPTS